MYRPRYGAPTQQSGSPLCLLTIPVSGSLGKMVLRDGIGNVLLAPVSLLLSRLLVQVVSTALAAKDVLIEKSNFTELSRYLERIVPVLQELQDKKIRDTPPMRLALDSLDREIKSANDLINECRTKSRIYLLYNCRNIVKRLQAITQEIGKSISLIPMATLDISIDTRDKTLELQKHMQEVEFKAALAEEEIIERLDTSVRERQADSNDARVLLHQIAQVVGVPNDPKCLSEELEKLKLEKEEALLRKSQAEAMQLQQIICFLSQVDDVILVSDREINYLKPRASGEVHPLPPWKSFFCPITNDVMKDPVEIASGQTFERTAIEKWFSAGNITCPITKAELENLEMQPNISLRNSIREWKDRNTFITIAATKSKLQSGKEEDILNTLIELHRLCEEKSIHRDWVREEGIIPVIIGLLSSNKNIRMKALATLQSMAVDNPTNKEKIAEAGAILYAVRSLARDVKEGRHAVALLLELSKDSRVCEQIGKVQGCILLLVTMSSSSDQAAAEDAKQILIHLSNNNQNVVQMAEANYFGPLVHCLLEGPEMTKILMASALARMGLTEQSKVVVATEGAIPPLVKMILNGKLEARTAALGALSNLSTHPDNRDPMISAGVIPPLLQLLFSVTSVWMNLKESAAATLANLATAAPIGFSSSSSYSSILDSDETICQLLSLLNLAGPAIQGHLLRALNGMASALTATSVRAKMRAGSAIQLLLPFCEASNSDVRVNAVKLLYSLSQDGTGRELVENIGQNHIQSFVNLLTSSREDEKSAAAGIISNLPLNDSDLTEMFYLAGALPALTDLLRMEGSRSVSGNSRNCLLENAARALIRFTLPSDLRMQRLTAEQDVIPLLVQVLRIGSQYAKKEAATVLSQLSENSKKLSTPIDTTARCCCLFSFSKSESACIVHAGRCSVRTSFCLIEADAVGPLVQVLEEDESEAHEAALCALSTLMQDETTLEKGIQVIDEAGGLKPIVRLLTVGMSGVKEKTCWMLERFFRLEKYRSDFGAQAQMALIDLAQTSSSATKSLAAKCLAHLKMLHNQSTYF